MTGYVNPKEAIKLDINFGISKCGLISLQIRIWDAVTQKCPSKIGNFSIPDSEPKAQENAQSQKLVVAG